MVNLATPFLLVLAVHFFVFEFQGDFLAIKRLCMDCILLISGTDAHNPFRLFDSQFGHAFSVCPDGEPFGIDFDFDDLVFDFLVDCCLDDQFPFGFAHLYADRLCLELFGYLTAHIIDF